MMVLLFQPAKRDERCKTDFRGKLHSQLRLAFMLAALALAPMLCGKELWRAPSDAAQMNNPLAQSKEVIERGKNLYMDRCVDCHGKKGKGDGPGAADLELQPPDFSQARVRQQPDGAFFWKISEGRKPMPGYARKLSEEERWALVMYLRSLSSH
jgi:mono/diheme cytochrome c family protein